MKVIRNKTYNNFMTIMNYIMKKKHYDQATALNLTHKVFDNVEANPGSNAWRFAETILSAEEYAAEYNQ